MKKILFYTCKTSIQNRGNLYSRPVKMSFRSKIVISIEHIYVNLFSFGRFDRKKYFVGKLFESFCSPGWRYAYISLTQCRKKKRNKDVPWPVSADVVVTSPWNIHFNSNDIPNFFSFGIYFQGITGIVIGEGTIIAPNVGLISSNHDINNFDEHLLVEPIVIGKKCWIGMNSVILPGVKLGDHTIVGAGSVVTKSFPEGNCVIVGNPARIIKKIK